MPLLIQILYFPFFDMISIVIVISKINFIAVNPFNLYFIVDFFITWIFSIQIFDVWDIFTCLNIIVICQTILIIYLIIFIIINYIHFIFILICLCGFIVIWIEIINFFIIICLCGFIGMRIEIIIFFVF